jgi:thioesterase domain-containing protein
VQSAGIAGIVAMTDSHNPMPRVTAGEAGSGVSWVAINVKGDMQPLFWITPDASQATVFRDLGRSQPIYCLRAPPVREGAPPYTLEQIAQRHSEAIRRIRPQGPYLLAGYCIAAVVAREVALQLAAQGQSVDRLIMIDPPDPAKSRAQLAKDPFVGLLMRAASRLLFHMRRLVSLSLAEKIDYCRVSLRAVVSRIEYSISRHAHRAGVSSGRPSRFNDGYHSAVAAFLNAAPGRYDGAVVLLRPLNVPAGAFRYSNARWLQLLSGSTKVIEVAGDSTSMWSAPDVGDLRARIQQCLSESKDLGDAPGVVET